MVGIEDVDDDVEVDWLLLVVVIVEDDVEVVVTCCSLLETIPVLDTSVVEEVIELDKLDELSTLTFCCDCCCPFTLFVPWLLVSPPVEVVPVVIPFI